MTKKYFFLGVVLLIFLVSNIFALTQPNIYYPNSTEITIHNGTEINWSTSIGSGEIAKYNLFYSNDSGTNWYNILLNWGYVNYLNNSNTEENITFSGNQNQTIYINIPKIANIIGAKLNLTGYQVVTSPYARVYDSLINESQSDGGTDSAYQATGFGRIFTNYPGINMYFVINNTPDLNADGIELLLAGAGSSPQNDNIVYHVNIAEINGFLTGNPIDNNITDYTRVKTNLACSQEWGTDQNVYKNITFDNAYLLDSSKNYIVWFEYASGSTHGSQYSLKFDTNAGIISNYTGVRNGLNNDSYYRIPGLRFYKGTAGNISNTWLEVGNVDGIKEWNQTGNFTTTNRTQDFNSSLQSYLGNNCTSELWENCTVPLTLHSDTAGKIQISAIDIQFTNYWWDTTNLNELTTYLVNITPTNSSANGTSVISGNNFAIAHDKPNVTLNLPPSDYSNSTSTPVNVDFNCSATDDFGLKNISLYITNNQNLSFGLNQTAIVLGNNSANWTLSLSNGNYTWNCLAYDNGGNFDWGENRSIIINYTAPSTTAASLPDSGSSGNSGSSRGKREMEFDVKIINADSPLEPKQFFNFTYFVKGIGKIQGDVLIEFWIEKNNIKITSGYDVIYFGTNEEKTETTQLFLPSKTSEDVYDFYVKASYEEYGAKAHRTIEAILPQVKLSPKELFFEEPHFWNKISNKAKSLFSIIFNYSKNNKNHLIIGFSILVLIIGIIAWIFYHLNPRDVNRLKGLKGIGVYSADGNKIGKVKEIYFEKDKSKIYGWLIKVDKNIFKKIKKKNILVKHGQVESIKQVMIVSNKVSEHLM